MIIVRILEHLSEDTFSLRRLDKESIADIIICLVDLLSHWFRCHGSSVWFPAGGNSCTSMVYRQMFCMALVWVKIMFVKHFIMLYVFNELVVENITHCQNWMNFGIKLYWSRDYLFMWVVFVFQNTEMFYLLKRWYIKELIFTISGRPCERIIVLRKTRIYIFKFIKKQGRF